MLPLGGKPSIQHVIERAKRIPGLSKVIVATSISEKDDKLAEFCHSISAPVFRGSEDDVLDRYYQAAKGARADIVVRVTGDCPLIDPIESGKVVTKLTKEKLDYASNIHPPFLPDGLDTEAFTIQALERAWEEADKALEREHVTLYIYSHPEMFTMGCVNYDKNLSDFRLTLDRNEDYILLERVFHLLKQRQQFGYLHEVVSLLGEHPSLLEINCMIKRNEGLNSPN